MPAELVYIGIGSNLADSISIVQDAINRLAKITKTELRQYSSLYQSEPIGDIAQDDYVNAVVALETSLSPTDLLLEMQAIEQNGEGLRCKLTLKVFTENLDSSD